MYNSFVEFTILEAFLTARNIHTALLICIVFTCIACFVFVKIFNPLWMQIEGAGTIGGNQKAEKIQNRLKNLYLFFSFFTAALWVIGAATYLLIPALIEKETFTVSMLFPARLPEAFITGLLTVLIFDLYVTPVKKALNKTGPLIKDLAKYNNTGKEVVVKSINEMQEIVKGSGALYGSK